MSLLAAHKQIERELADARVMGVCTRLPAFCCRTGTAKRCELKEPTHG